MVDGLKVLPTGIITCHMKGTFLLSQLTHVAFREDLVPVTSFFHLACLCPTLNNKTKLDIKLFQARIRTGPVEKLLKYVLRANPFASYSSRLFDYAYFVDYILFTDYT